MWLLAFAVFTSDAFIGYFGGLYFDARLESRLARTLIFSSLLDAAIGINAMGFVSQGWWMLVPSVAGGTLGTLLSMRGGAFYHGACRIVRRAVSGREASTVTRYREAGE